MVDLWVPGIWPGTVRLHTPRRLRRWIVNRFPAYLLRRNVLGPPSVIVLKESLRAPFDPRIPWMVDVEWYHRILCVGGYKVHSLDGAALVHTGHGHSISQSMEGPPPKGAARSLEFCSNRVIDLWYCDLMPGQALGFVFSQLSKRWHGW